MEPDNVQVQRSWTVQKRFHGLSDDDRRLLERFRPQFEVHAAGILEDLFQHLRSAQLLTAASFERPHLDPLKASFLARFRAAATGAGDLDDFQAAMRHAELLDQAGLPPHYFVACHTRALDYLAVQAGKDWTGTPKELAAWLAAFARALFVNAAAGSEAYARLASSRFARGYQETLDIRVGLEELHTVVRELAAELSVPGILDKVGIAARKLSRSDASFLWIVPEGSSNLVPMVAEGMSEESLEPIHFHVGEGFVGTVAAEMRALEADLWSDDRVAAKEFFRRHGLRQAMALPIISKGSVKGVLAVVRREAKVIGEMEKKLLTSLASFSGVSLELAQLYQQTLTTRTSLDRLHEIARDLSVELDLLGLLRKIIDGASELARSEAVILWTLSEDGRQLVPSVWTGLPDEAGQWTEMAGARGLGEVLHTLAPLEVDFGSFDYGLARDRFGRAGLRSAFCLPIIHLGKPVSVLLVARRHFEPYTPNEREVISTLASFAASAMERSKLVQDAVRARVEWESTFESIQDLVLVVDPAERIVRANHSFLKRAGLGADQVIGRPWFQAVGLDAPQPANYQDLLRKGRPVSAELHPPRLAGTFQLDASNMRGGGGAVTGTVLVLRDVTEKKRLEHQLLQAEKLSAIGQLVSGVAHELNNPMSSVMGFAELAEKTAGLPEETKGYLTIVRDEAQRAVKIVKNLLTFARQHKPERIRTSLHELIDRVGQLTGYELRAKHIRLERDLDASLPDLMIDPHQIQQVLLNLVTNARQAMEELPRKGGMITIRTRRGADKVIFSVVDDGPGIKADVLPKIFDPFFTTKPVGKGTGLGLSVCYGIVNEHGGYMWAESPPGGGAAFHVELPISSGETVVRRKPAPAPAGPRQLRIIVVDDEPPILEFVKRILSEGNTVVVSGDARAAADQILREAFDVVITDFRMPGFTGEDLYRLVMERKPEMSRRIMFMTGDVFNEEAKDFLVKAGLPVLEKPFSSEELLSALNSLVAAK